MRTRGLTATANTQVVPVGVPAEIATLNFAGFTNVKLHNGAIGGPVLVEVTAAGVYNFPNTLTFPNGVFAEIAGTGSLTIWVA